MNKIALITGATAGIGEASALKLASEGYNLIITGRREERLIKLSSKIEISFGVEVKPLCFDIRKNKEVENNINGLSDKWKEIDVLINNAGLAAGLAPIQSSTVENWERMIDTNIKGVLYISKIVSNLMIKRGKGDIINIGSIAGKEVYRNGNVYCATKHAIDAITKGMRIDLLEYGIRVTSICPGMADTEFSLVRLGTKEAADKVYEGLTPLYAEDIAEAILFAISRPPHVTINDMLIMPTAQANSAYTHRKK